MNKKGAIKVESSRIKAIAAELEMTSDEFGKEVLGITGATYRNKLSGNNGWTLTDIVRIHKVSGHTFDYLFGLADH